MELRSIVCSLALNGNFLEVHQPAGMDVAAETQCHYSHLTLHVLPKEPPNTITKPELIFHHSHHPAVTSRSGWIYASEFSFSEATM